MRLRGIEFGPCLDAAGVRGFFGEGYWFHPLFRRIFGSWFSFEGSIFVAKTTTLRPRLGPPSGNMRIQLHRPFWPRERFPRCIWWSWFTGRTLNAVSLAGPGARTLLEHGLISRAFEPYTDPIMISFMAVGQTFEERLEETHAFIALVKQHVPPALKSNLGLQINVTCPNTGLDTSKLVHDARAMLDIAQELDIPIVVKLNLLARIEDVKAIAEHKACDALCFTNALPFGTLPHAIPWARLFPNGSPLANRNKTFGGGGYSGRDLLPLVTRFCRELRAAGVTKPFCVGGGVRSARDVGLLVLGGRLRPGHDSVFFASAAMVRPWRVRSIIRRAHKLLG